MMYPPAVEPLRFRQMPMLAAAMAFAAGEIVARHWIAAARLYVALALLLVIAVVAMWTARRVMLWAVLALWVAVGAFALQVTPQPMRQVSAARYADGLSREVVGEVVDVRPMTPQSESDADGAALQPWEIEPGGWEQEAEPARTLVDVKLRAVEEVTPDEAHMRPMNGGVRVMLRGEAPALRCGDVLRLPMRLQVPDEYRDAGAWSRREFLLQQGIGLEAKAAGEKVIVAQHGRVSATCHLREAQRWAVARMDRFVQWQRTLRWPKSLRLRAGDEGTLQAMLFGERSGLAMNWRQELERTGTFHLVVVSGLHVTLLAGALLWLLLRLRVPERVAIPVTLLLMLGFALLTGFGVPVQRALLMCAVYLLARMLQRERSAMNALGMAAMAVLLLDPRALFTASFQMTFCVIVAAAGVAAPIAERSYGRYHVTLNTLKKVEADAWLAPDLVSFRVAVRLWRAVLRDGVWRPLGACVVPALRLFFTLCDALLFGAAVELCMALPVAVHFHRAALLALPVNVVAVPLMFVLLVLTVVMFLLSLMSAWLAAPVAAIVALGLHFLQAIVGHAGGLSAAEWRLPGPDAVRVVAACAAIAVACWALRAKARWAWSGAAVLAAAMAFAVLWLPRPQFSAGLLEVTAVDVGQGDSLLVVTPEGRTLLVDAGGPVGGVRPQERWDIGEDVVSPYLWSRGVARLDAMALTHAHSDHMGGMLAVLRNFRPRELWLSVAPGKAEGLQRLVAEAQQMGVRVRWLRAGDAPAPGVVVLAPEAGYSNPREAANNDSLVLDVRAGHAEALLEGDAERSSEAAMVANGKLHPVTLLKVGHHGSRTSTTEAFAAAVRPKAAMVSVGRRNTFGHPRWEVLETLEMEGTRVFRTDRLGAVTVLMDPATGGFRETDAMGR
ncbi:MAG: ComEC/Rec2 family competence protein [Acidobacteriaceae bacterium]|nr:ComEC/Rec2 family competence protein [Acidobacteriaceae bacterium]